MMSHGAMIRRHGRRAAFIVVVSMMLSGALLIMLAQIPRERGEDTQRALVKKFVYEGYVEWAIHHPEQKCPGSLQVVAEEMGRKDTKDAWARELLWYCGDDLPPPAKRDGFAVVSIGPDGIAGTADDIKSWD